MLGWFSAEAERASISKRDSRTGSLRHLARERLQRDVASEAGVAGAVDLPHATGPEAGHDLVLPEPSACGDLHGGQGGTEAMSKIRSRPPGVPRGMTEHAIRGIGPAFGAGPG